MKGRLQISFNDCPILGQRYCYFKSYAPTKKSKKQAKTYYYGK